MKSELQDRLPVSGIDGCCGESMTISAEAAVAEAAVCSGSGCTGSSVNSGGGGGGGGSSSN